MSHSEFEDLCAAFALGALDGPDLAKLREHLPGCATCRQRVLEFEESSTWMALGLEPVKPSAQTKQAVMARISGAHGQAGRAQPAVTPLVAIALTVAVLALGATAAAGWLFLDAARRRDELEAEVALLAADKAALERKAQVVDVLKEELERTKRALAEAERRGATAEADLAAARAELERLRRIEALLQAVDARVFDITQRLAPEAGTAVAMAVQRGRDVVFIAKGLPAVRDHAYELWTMDAGGGVAKAGLFADLREGGAVVGLGAMGIDPANLSKFAISLEDADGSSKPDAPEGPVILISP